MRRIGLKIIILLAITISAVILITKNDERQVEQIRRKLDSTLPCPPALFDTINFLTQVEEGKRNFNNVVGIPDVYEYAFNLAFYYFPELAHVNLEIVYEKIGTTLQTRPKGSSLFKRKDKREYQIFINSNSNFEGILFKDVPLNAQVGLIAHELAHILDYEHKNSLQIIGTGIKFSNKASKSSYEKSIDLLTIYKGLGRQLKDWATYSMYTSTASSEYKQFKKDVYLEPKEIEEIIFQYPGGCPSL